MSYILNFSFLSVFGRYDTNQYFYKPSSMRLTYQKNTISQFYKDLSIKLENALQMRHCLYQTI